MVLEAFSNFFARSMHGQRGQLGAQADRQVPALAGFKRAASLFEPTFEAHTRFFPTYFPGSSTVRTRSAAGPLSVCRIPLGQRISTESILVSGPSPKCTRLSLED